MSAAPLQENLEEPVGEFRPLRRHAWREIAAYLQIPRLMVPVMPQPTDPTGVPVLLVPGFLAGDWSLRVLSSRLRRAGHQTFGSGIKVNAACTQVMVERVERRLAEATDEAGGQVALVGHSRGGTLAKLVAQSRPDLVAGLVTVCSPNINPMAASPATLKQAELLAKLGSAGVPGVLRPDCLHGDCASWTRDRLTGPFPDEVSFVALYSKGDGILDWRSSLDPAARHIKVGGSHNGMTTNARAHRTIQRQLAALTVRNP